MAVAAKAREEKLREFDGVDDLATHLGRVNRRFQKYSEALWAGGITSVEQLGKISNDELQALGVTDSAHAEIIRRNARLAGLEEKNEALSQRAEELKIRFQKVSKSARSVLRQDAPDSNQESNLDSRKEGGSEEG